ncbi:MAG: Fic family protein [Chloroflexi bacterium]|nr:Fic family protein [Chloroflexota bacterium]
MERETSRRGRPSRAAVYASLDAGLADLQRVGGLPHPSEAEQIWRGIWYEETHNSTAIEGNTLALRQVRALLDEGRAVGDKELREYLEVQAYAEAAQWVYEQAVGGGDGQGDELLTLTELRQVHRLVVEPVWAHFPPNSLHPDEGPGSFRHHELAAFPGGIQPPPFVAVPGLIDGWLRAVNGGPSAREHLVEHLATAHAGFEKVHPFRDGNGRTGRLLVNLLLVRRGYPPAIIHKRDGTKYIAALDRADRQSDVGALGELFARAVNDGINRFLLPSLAGPHRLVPLSALASASLSAPALRIAAERGRLRGRRQNGRWYSTRQWVEEYVGSRYRRPSHACATRS